MIVAAVGCGLRFVRGMISTWYSSQIRSGSPQGHGSAQYLYAVHSRHPALFHSKTTLIRTVLPAYGCNLKGQVTCIAAGEGGRWPFFPLLAVPSLRSKALVPFASKGFKTASPS